MGGWISNLNDAAKTVPSKEPAAIAVAEPPAKPAAEPPPPAGNPPAKPAAASAASDPEVDEDGEKWPRKAADWKQFKAARKEEKAALEKQRDDIKAEKERLATEIETLRKSGPSPELDELRKERDALSDRLRTVAVEKHPKFEAYFAKKTGDQIELAKQIVGSEHAASIEKLLKQPDSDYRRQSIRELVAALDPLDQSQVGGVLNSLSQIERERQTEISNARTNFDALTKQEQDANTQRQTQRFKDAEKTFNDTVARAKAENFLFKNSDNTEWNKSVEERLSAARKLVFETQDPPRLMQAALDAVAMPALLQDSLAKAKEIESLKAQVARLSAAAPTATPGERPASEKGDEPAIKPGMNPWEASQKFVQSMMSGTK